MLKGRFIRLCAVALAAVLAGCGGQGLQVRGQKDGEKSSEEGNAAEGNPEGDEASSSSYPKIAKVSGSRFHQVFYAEGCYCIFDGQHYGFLTEEGEEVTPFLYEWAAPFSEGLACVCLDGKYGFIGKGGEVKIPFLYDQASSFSEGLAYFRKGEDYGFLDHEGRVVLRPDCDSVSSFQEGRAYFSVDGLYGYLDGAGKVVAEPVYEDAGSFRDGLAMVMRNGLYGLIGADGKEILPTVYDAVEVEEGFLLAEREGLQYCFDRDGRELLEPGRWDFVSVREGMLVAGRDGLHGLIDGDGKVLLELECESLWPIPERELVIVGKDGTYGVTDYFGRERVPFAYSGISYDDDGRGGLRVTRVEAWQEGQETGERERKGYLGFTEGDSFAEIPAVYDAMSYFTEDRAVVKRDGKYGIIRRDGSLEYPLEYDSIRLFENGAAALWKEQVAELADRDGNVICMGTFDTVALCGKCYEIKQGGKYGLLDEQGKRVVPAFYDDSSGYEVYGAGDVRLMVRYDQDSYLLVKTGEGAGSGTSKVLLQNHVTPRRKEYMDFLQRAERKDSLNVSEYHVAFRNFGKLYRMGEEVILYHRMEPYEQMLFPMSASGFYVFRDGKAEELAAGGECGGSMRGDYVCFWYDRAESRLKLGVAGAWGGFGGYSYTGSVHELQREGTKVTADWERVCQISANYGQEELLRDAVLFFDDQGKPYTRETILEAEHVTEYQVDGKRVSPERFAEVQERYCYRDALD